jgi:hypothetical protein
MIGKYLEQETSERLARAEQALKRALDLNPDLSLAENALAHLEVDLGRAEASMVRLLRRAKDRPADPDLYAGLTHACRYCGLLSAAAAAAEQSRRLDARLRTTAPQVDFMRHQYARVYEETADPYMRALALLMMDRPVEALSALEGLQLIAGHRLSFFIESLRHTILGDRERAGVELRRLRDIPDPEARFYVARNLSYIGAHDEALALMDTVVDGGFFCLPALAQDPWLDPLRGAPEFAAALRRAEARHRQAVISFFNGEGDRLLGVLHPT